MFGQCDGCKQYRELFDFRNLMLCEDCLDEAENNCELYDEDDGLLELEEWEEDYRNNQSQDKGGE